MTDTANEIDTGIRWTEGAVEVDATLVARGLNLPIEQFMAEMRRGIVYSTSERGNTSLSDLVADIDIRRHPGNLSSALRLFVLDHFRVLMSGTSIGDRVGAGIDMLKLRRTDTDS